MTSKAQQQPTPKLTQKDIETLLLMADGKTVPEIALITGLHFRSVESRVARIKQKVGVYSGTHLVATALRNGWIQ